MIDSTLGQETQLGILGEFCPQPTVMEAKVQGNHILCAKLLVCNLEGGTLTKASIPLPVPPLHASNIINILYVQRVAEGELASIEYLPCARYNTVHFMHVITRILWQSTINSSLHLISLFCILFKVLSHLLSYLSFMSLCEAGVTDRNHPHFRENKTDTQIRGCAESCD